MKKAFEINLYVKVLRDRFKILDITDLSSEKVFTPSQSFSTTRLLVGQFSAAEECLGNALKSFTGKGLFPKSPAIIIHPQELVDGGLSEVEERLFKELALGAGGRKVALWLGDELSTEQAMKLLENA